MVIFVIISSLDVIHSFALPTLGLVLGLSSTIGSVNSMDLLVLLLIIL
jgi:hypothetical protein